MINFDLQRFAEVVHGSSQNDNIASVGNDAQAYGLAGDDYIEGSGSNVIMSGGSGNDIVHFKGGNATLNGGAGNDIFGVTYSKDAPSEVLIEDIDPINDKIIINYAGNEAPSLNYTVDETNVYGKINYTVHLTDADGNLNITLKDTRPLDEYYDQEGNEYLWEVFRIVNEEREKEGLAPLTLSQEIMNSADVRANELTEFYSHTRPDGSPCYTALENNVGYRAENIAVGQTSPEQVMNRWMNSPGHRANILNERLSRFGVGYVYEKDSDWKHHWVQMFRSYEYGNDNLSLDELLNTNVTALLNGSTVFEKTLRDIGAASTVANEDDETLIITVGGVYDAGEGNDLIINGQYFDRGASETTLIGGAGNDTITNHGSNSVLIGGAGDDEIHNGYHFYQPWNAYYEEAPSNNDNDAAFNGSNVSIDAGAGDDSIDNIGSNVTVRGGTGNDTVNHAAHYIYAIGDGNDVITDYSSDSTIHIIGGGIDGSLRSNYNADVILNIGDGSIKIKNAADIPLNIIADVNDDTTVADDTTTSTAVDDTTVDTALNVGEGTYLFDESTGVTDDPIKVYYYRPSTWQSGDSIAFVFHGMNRNADDYRRSWERYAEANNLLIICPEFTDEKYPGSRYYNTGNVTDNNGNLQPEEDRIFDVIDRIIVDAKQRTDSIAGKVLAFGHSAGAQFIHRYALFDEESESDMIISANAGWYTMPDDGIKFPYGIDGTDFSDAQLKRAFAKNVVVMLGEEDTLRSDDLRTTEEADAQGLNRFERGQKFFETCQAKAAELKTDFNWKLITVPNVGHSNSGMAQAAAAVYNDWLSGDGVFDDDTTVEDDTTTVEEDTTTVEDDTTTVEDDTTTVEDDTTTAGNDDTTVVDGNNKLYGTADADVFKYRADGGRTTLGKKSDVATLYNAADKIVILGDDVSSADLIIKDKKKSLIATFKGDKKSRLTINKADSLDAVQFYFGADVDDALENEPFIYGLTEGVTLNSKGTRVDVLPTVENATINLADISTKAKTLDGSAAGAELHLVGNGVNNVLTASAYGSTLDGGWNNAKDKGTKDKLYGGAGADVFIFDGQSKDVIYNYDADDRIVIDGAFDGVKVTSRDVVLKSGKNTLTLKNAIGAEISITDNNSTERYAFTRENNSLDKARLSSNAQRSADYWFAKDDPSKDQLSALIEPSTFDNAIAQVDDDEEYSFAGVLRRHELSRVPTSNTSDGDSKRAGKSVG